ncbi:MAG TPA: DUF4062 domain-containing protein [Gallionellaceae bacterium]|nr:DUF4062 domain-containing protein [Gallionellaceae bacterium]
MATKYQVFVSSTFTDLKNERQAAVEAILAAGHIPAGMELFAAGDESQLEVIRRWIDDSDVYMLILGGRYGSVDPSTGVSYTELEYDYAVQKGMPLFAVVLSERAIDAKSPVVINEHRESKNSDKYEKFRKKVLSKISKVVDDCKDIKIGILESIRSLEHRHSLQGWVRSSELKDVTPLMAQLSTLVEENSHLKNVLAERPESLITADGEKLAGLDDEVTITISYRQEVKSNSKYSSSNYYDRTKQITLAWGRLFSLFAPELLSGKADDYMQGYIAKQLFGDRVLYLKVIEQDFQTIKVHLMALGLIDTKYSSTVKGGAALFWHLTPAGKKTMMELRTIKK